MSNNIKKNNNSVKKRTIKKTNSKSKTKSKRVVGNKSLIFNLLAIAFAVLAIFMIFANVSGVSKGNHLEYAITGIQATFGFSESTKLFGLLINTQFSFLNLNIYILLISGVILTILRVSKLLKSNIIDWVALGIFFAAGILYFVMPHFVIYGSAWKGAVNILLDANYVKTPLVGSIIGGLSSIAAASLILIDKLTKKDLKTTKK